MKEKWIERQEADSGRRTRRREGNRNIICKAVLAGMIFWAGFIVLLVVGVWLLWRYNMIGNDERIYTGADFGIEQILSGVDFDGDGIDDYDELVIGARKDAENHPKYDGAYVQGGFPSEDVGVCTDVIWRAFREAGYDLREMVDADIAARPEAYPWIEQRDKNIDFRRVNVLNVFFSTYGESLTTNPEEIAEWQPGDIIIADNGNHIGIVSDRRTKDGRVLIIHNGGQPMREEDYFRYGEVVAHYRVRVGEMKGVIWK